MELPKNILNSENYHFRREHATTKLAEVELVIDNFVKLYDARAAFFTDSFIKKVKEGNRKALSELQRHSLPPTPMDLRHEFAKCLKANISDEHTFSMKDGRLYTMKELKHLIPEWSSLAEQALMESDSALADKLMSSVQWNAKSAFEVTFVSAMNALKELKRNKQTSGSFDHYMKWIIAPLKQAIEHVKAVQPPGNSLIGYGNRLSLTEAMSTAENLQNEFQKVLAGKKS